MGSIGATAAPTVPPTTAPTRRRRRRRPRRRAAAPPADANLRVPAGFLASTIAHVGSARELAALPNGDLIVGTSGTTVVIVPNAESAGVAGTPATFATLADAPAQGRRIRRRLRVRRTQHGVYRIPYTTGAQSGTRGADRRRCEPVRRAELRRRRAHHHSVAVSGSTLYVGVGSSCNACAETDPTRATVQRMGIDGSAMTTQAKRWRNAIALATDPSTGTVWAGGAGQDTLAQAIRTSSWTRCRRAPRPPITAGRTAKRTTWRTKRRELRERRRSRARISRVLDDHRRGVLPERRKPDVRVPGGLARRAVREPARLVARDGTASRRAAARRVRPVRRRSPARAVNWSDPTAQWNDFFTGFQRAAAAASAARPASPSAHRAACSSPTSDGAIYRIRPLARRRPAAAAKLGTT